MEGWVKAINVLVSEIPQGEKSQEVLKSGYLKKQGGNFKVCPLFNPPLSLILDE